jgi:hypothetical protein
MTRLARLLIAVAIAAPLLLSPSGPAFACSCAPLKAKQVVHRADAIVAGHVIGEQTISTMETQSTVAVDGVYKGDVEATITLTANIGTGGGSSCAVLYPVGTKVDPLVLQRLDNGTYEVAICAMLSTRQVQKVLGDPQPPPPSSAVPSPPAAAAPAPVTGISWAAATGGVGLAVAGMALVLWLSGRRKPQKRPSPFETQGPGSNAEDPAPTESGPTG